MRAERWRRDGEGDEKGESYGCGVTEAEPLDEKQAEHARSA